MQRGLKQGQIYDVISVETEGSQEWESCTEEGCRIHHESGEDVWGLQLELHPRG